MKHAMVVRETSVWAVRSDASTVDVQDAIVHFYTESQRRNKAMSSRRKGRLAMLLHAVLISNNNDTITLTKSSNQIITLGQSQGLSCAL